MTNNTNPFSLSFHRYGPVAAKALKSPTPGEVIAIFDSCFYVNLNDVIICIGASNFVDGPLNIISSAPEKTNWPACGLNVGDEAIVQNHQLRLGTRLTFDLNDPVVWSPASSLGPIDFKLATSSLRQFYAAELPAEGLAPLVFGAEDAPLPQARPFVRSLSDWLNNNLGSSGPPVDGPAIEDLMGLGPGLTPSGDDFIGAVMITLQRINEGPVLEKLSDAVKRRVRARTNPISAQHLLAASEGLGSAAFHEVLTALESLDQNLHTKAFYKLASVGHTSGWDAMAGLYTTLIMHQNTRLCGTMAA